MMIFAPGSSLGGARPKASVYDQYGNLSIAKLPKVSDGYSVERWEAIALDMAAAVNINVSSHNLLEVSQKTVFLSKRFDRIHVSGQADQRIPFMSAMAATEHNDGDHTCSYLEIVDVINQVGAEPVGDRAELFRRIAFSILITNTDDHFRNHGFLWSGRKGWRLSPVYDINPVPNGNRILSTRIDFDDASASMELLRSVAEYFVATESADQIINECSAVVREWRDFARTRGATDSEIKFMRSAFEHEEQGFYRKHF